MTPLLSAGHPLAAARRQLAFDEARQQVQQSLPIGGW
jgi:hypothetical protein